VFIRPFRAQNVPFMRFLGTIWSILPNRHF
jgi:hypothetical protein